MFSDERVHKRPEVEADKFSLTSDLSLGQILTRGACALFHACIDMHSPSIFFLLDLPDEALIQIFRIAASFEEYGFSGPLTARDYGREDSLNPFAAWREPLTVLSLASCCKRFNSLYRENVSRVIFAGVYSADACSRVFERFPAARSAEFSLPDPGWSISDYERFLQNALNAQVHAGFRSIKLQNASITLLGFRGMMQLCTGLEKLGIFDCRLYFRIGGRPNCVLGEECSHYVFGRHAKLGKVTLKNLRIDSGTHDSTGRTIACTLAWLPALRELVLQSKTLRWQDVSHLSCLSSLEFLSLSSSRVPSMATQRMASIFSQMTELQHLRLHNIHLHCEGDLLLPPALKNLEVAACPFRIRQQGRSISGSPAKFKLKGKGSLMKLSISDCFPRQFDYFIPAIAQLEELRVEFNIGTAEPKNIQSYVQKQSAYEALFGLLSECSGLTRLELIHCVSPEPEFFVRISDLASLRELTLDLNVSQGGIEEDILLLTSGPCRHSLRLLEVRIDKAPHGADYYRELVSSCFDSCVLEFTSSEQV